MPEAVYAETGGLCLQLDDFNTVFRMLSAQPMFVNDYDVSTDDNRKKLNQLLMSQYDGDTLESTASCVCGATRKGFYVGNKCPICKQPVFVTTEQPLESYLWIRTPHNVAALMNPIAWTMLDDLLTNNKISLLQWAVMPNYHVKAGHENKPLLKIRSVLLSKVFADGTTFKRSWNYFYEHFDEIIEILITLGGTGNKASKAIMFEWIKQNREKIFCSYLPLPSRLAFITESNPTGVYADTTMRSALAAVRCISDIEFPVVPLSESKVETHCVKSIMFLAEYYYTFFKKNVSPKLALARQHIFGSRVNFSFRAVVSSISGEHRYDEVYLPWKVAVPLLQVHLSKKLLDRGYSANDIIQYISEHVNKYDPLLDQMFQELIAESPEGGIPILLNRNPSLLRGFLLLLSRGIL